MLVKCALEVIFTPTRNEKLSTIEVVNKLQFIIELFYENFVKTEQMPTWKNTPLKLSPMCKWRAYIRQCVNGTGYIS